MARYHGKNGVVYISTTASGTAVALTGAASWSLDMPTDRVEVTAFGDTEKQYVVGLKDVSGQIEGWFDDTSDQLYDAMAGGERVKLYLYPTASAATKFWSGTAFIDFSIETGVSEGVAVRGTFSGAGAWSQA